MIQAINFDLDGLLIDTEPMHCRAYIETFADHGIPLTEERYVAHWIKQGGTIDQFLAELGSKMDPAVIRSEKRVRYQAMIRENLRLMPGAASAVEALSKHFALTVVSNSWRQDVELMLQLTDISRYFDVTVSANEVEKGKPDPAGFLRASKLLEIAPRYMLVLEDAEKGIVAAHRAGMESIAIPTDYTRQNDFSLATRVVGSLQEVTPELVKSL